MKPEYALPFGRDWPGIRIWNNCIGEESGGAGSAFFKSYAIGESCVNPVESPFTIRQIRQNAPPDASGISFNRETIGFQRLFLPVPDVDQKFRLFSLAEAFRAKADFNFLPGNVHAPGRKIGVTV